VIIENGVQSIGESAFYYCKSLVSISIPKSVSSVGRNAFKACELLTNVEYGGNKSAWQKMVVAEGNDPLKNAKISYK
jgi:hypothetical protein